MGRTGGSRSGLPRWGCAATFAVLLAAPGPLWAGRATDLASTFDEKGILNASLRAGYQRTLKRGSLKREFERSTTAIETVKELRFSQVRHLLDLRADFTIFKALQVYVGLPIVLGDSRNFDFAQNGGDPCGDPPESNCVTPRNSTLMHDPPSGRNVGWFNPSGFSDRQVALAGPDGAPGGLLLPNRSGLDQIHVGLVGAPLSQLRDPSKPTWTIGFEARVGVGESMEYDPARPAANTSVGQGLNHYVWWTSVSRRFRYLEPWMSFYYALPQVKGGSQYSRTSFSLSGQERAGAQQRGGGEAGVEIIPWEQKQHHRRLTLELSGRIEGVFEGRGYSDVWELFANQPRLAGPCRPDPASLDPRKWSNGYNCASTDQLIPFPGITNIENYAIFGGSLAVGVELTRFVRARIGVGLAHEQSHFITFGDPGRAGGEWNTEPAAAPACKAAGPNSVCILDERQVNPMYRILLDSTGHRFRVDETTIFDFFVGLQGQF